MKKKYFISADIEGCCDVTSWHECEVGGVGHKTAVSHGREAQFFINVCHHGVFGGLQILTFHGIKAMLGGNGEHLVDDKLFHAPLQHTAAHQPGVHEQPV